MYRKTYFIFIILLVLLQSCIHKKGETIRVEEGQINNSRSFETEYFFPSPNEVVDVLEQSNFNLNPDLLTEIDFKKTYINNQAKSLNLGIFTTDLAFVVRNKDTQKALQYLDVVFYLCSELNISTIATIETVERIKNNMNVIDSLQFISNELFVDFIEILKSDNREDILSMVALGSYIEAFYVTSYSVNNYIDYFETVKSLSNQKIAFENCISFIDGYKEDENIATLLGNVSYLIEIYEEIQPIKNTSRLISNRTEKTIVGGGYQYIMSEDQFETYKLELSRLKQLFLEL